MDIIQLCCYGMLMRQTRVTRQSAVKREIYLRHIVKVSVTDMCVLSTYVCRYSSRCPTDMSSVCEKGIN